MFSKFLLLIFLIQFGNTQKLEIKNLHKDPILVIKTNDCKLQIGNIKLIHPIDLSNLENVIKSMNRLIINKVNDRLEIYKIVEQKLKKLNNNFYQIKPIHQRRRKRWDTLGSAWKWIAGTPDAQDLRIINSTMNDLITQNNQQYQINGRINQRIQLITDTINKAITNNTIANRITFTEIELITTIINIETVNGILEDIQEAIIRTKSKLPSNKILSLKEVILIKDLMINQGVNISLPDEALQYVTPKIAVNDNTLLYILQIPKLEEEKSTAMMIVPLIINNTIIREYPQYLIRTNQKLFTTTKHDNFVQKHTEIKEFEDDCILPLVMGTRSHCNVTKEKETTLQFIAEDKLVISNAINETLSSDCGPNNRTLTGNFLISFWNCTVTFKNKKFKSYEIKSEKMEIQGALHNLQATRQLIKELSVDEIVQENIENRKQLNKVYLKQINQQTWIWSLSGGLSLSTIGIIILLIYASIQRYTTTIKIDNPRSSTTKNTEPNANSQYRDLLVKIGITPKNEDVLSLPQGGVMGTHIADT